MFWQTSLLGAHVVGGDIHSEYFVSSLTMQSGWDLNYPQQYNASIVVTILAPFLGKVVNLIWVYKIIMPIFLAAVSLVVYYVFKRQIGETKAFWATIFFMIVPIMTLEVVGIAKSMVAELFFALFILILISNMRFKFILLPFVLFLTIASHYTVGLMLLAYVAGLLIIMCFTRWKYAGKVSLITLCITLAVGTVGGYYYLKNITAGEMVLRTMVLEAGMSIPSDLQIDQPSIAMFNPDSNEGSIAGDILTSEYNPIQVLQTQSNLVKVGIGLDMAGTSLQGKIFRVVQYVTELLIILGLVQLWRKRNELKFTPEFIALILLGLASLLIAIVVPDVANVINMTRIYHFSLFFLAPLLILGCELIWKARWFLPSILLVYFIFTSGLVFEVTHSMGDKLDVPYSIPLSYERTAIVEVPTQDDLNCVKWIVSQDDEQQIMAGYGTSYLLVCYIGATTRHFMWDTRIPYSLSDHYKGYYVISSWEAEHDLTVKYVDIGLRTTTPLPDISDLPIVYQSGNAIVRVRQ